MIISVFDRVENIVGNGEILVQAISPFPTMFQKASFPDLSKGVFMWEWVNGDHQLMMYAGKLAKSQPLE